jgi:hypothetical protein
MWCISDSYLRTNISKTQPFANVDSLKVKQKALRSAKLPLTVISHFRFFVAKAAMNVSNKCLFLKEKTFP